MTGATWPQQQQQPGGLMWPSDVFCLASVTYWKYSLIHYNTSTYWEMLKFLQLWSLVIPYTAVVGAWVRTSFFPPPQGMCFPFSHIYGYVCLAPTGLWVWHSGLSLEKQSLFGTVFRPQTNTKKPVNILSSKGVPNRSTPGSAALCRCRVGGAVAELETITFSFSASGTTATKRQDTDATLQNCIQHWFTQTVIFNDIRLLTGIGSLIVSCY